METEYFAIIIAVANVIFMYVAMYFDRPWGVVCCSLNGIAVAFFGLYLIGAC